MNDQANDNPPQPAQPQPQPQGQPNQVQLHGGVYPTPDGKWMVGIWFSGFATEPAAQHMSGQLEQLIKQSFAPKPPEQK